MENLNITVYISSAESFPSSYTFLPYMTIIFSGGHWFIITTYSVRVGQRFLVLKQPSVFK